MSDYHINIFYSEEDGGYIADIPDWIPAPLSVKPQSKPWTRWKKPKRSGLKRPINPVNPYRPLVTDQ
jgi:hypothetical protein